MPFCPVCRLEYRPGFDECSDCGVGLVDELPAEPRPMRVASTSEVVVARVHGQALAHMWAELLDNNGIANRLTPVTSIVDTVYPTDTVYEVLVAATDAPRARAVLPPRPGADRISRIASTPTDNDVLDEIDRAIAKGDLDLADELLESLQDAEMDGC
jgi:hypothetical protein